MLKAKKYLFPAVFVLILCAVVLSFGLVRPNAVEQSKTPENLPIKTEQPKKIVSVLPTPPANAATENAKLKDSLAWSFGGKAQRGWYLYESLIQHTINTEASTDSPAFANAVSGWQSKSKLKSNGLIDEITLAQLIKYWQSQRINSSQYPSDDQLTTAPTNDFYDSSRAEDLRKVERVAYTAYKKMVAAAAKDLKLKTTETGELAAGEKFLKIISAFRSREYQDKLRAASPNSGRAGLAVNSPHFTGRALDIYVGGEPVSTADANRAVQVQTPAYKWLVKNAARFGFYPYFYEPWHWEYKG